MFQMCVCAPVCVAMRGAQEQDAMSGYFLHYAGTVMWWGYLGPAPPSLTTVAGSSTAASIQGQDRFAKPEHVCGCFATCCSAAFGLGRV